MSLLNDFLWNNFDTSAQPLREYARHTRSRNYYPIAPLSTCNCSEPILDNCGDKVMLCTPEQLIASSYLDSNIDRKQLRTAVLFAQTLLEEHLGYCFMNKLYSWKLDNTVVNDFDTEQMINEYIVPIIAYKVQSELAVPLSFKEKNTGVVNISGEVFNSSSRTDITYLKNYYEQKFQFYLDRLEKHLRCIKQLCLCHHRRYKTNIVL